MLEEMDRIPKTRLDSSMIRILPNPQERIRLERLEEIFHSGLHKIVNMIGDNNTNPVILQRLRAFLFMYIKRVGVRFFHEVMSTEEGVIRFLKLIVERMRFAMLNSHTDSKRVTSPSDTFLIPRGGPDATITPHYHRRYQPYAQQQYRLQIPVHPAVETFSQGIPPNVFAESCRSPYKDMVPNNFGDGNRHWNNHPVSQSPRLPIREDNITLDLDSIQDFSSDLLEFLNNTSVLPELNFNTDLDFSVVRDDLDAMERCLYVRSNPGSDFTASSSSVCSSASQSPPTPRHIFPNNIRSDDRGSFYSDSESSEMSVQVVPNILYDRSDDERNLMSNLERSDCSNSNSPVMAMNELYSPSGRFLSSPLSTHMGQLTVNTHDVELKSQKKTMISAHPNDLSVGVSQPLHVNFNNFICVDDNMTGRHGVSPELKHQPAVKSHRRDNTDSFPPKKPMNPSDKQTTEACIPEEKQKSIYPFEYRSAREEILAMLDPTKKEEFVKHVAKLPEKDLLQIDDDGDTQLMILVSSEEQFNYAQLYALVERLKHYPQLFLVRNKQGLTALFMAMWRNRPIVAGYLAETMAELSLDLGVTFKKGNTLFHYIATVGDDMTTILAYLARIKKPNGKQAVNFNVHNHNGRTVIHEAIMRHGTPMSEENGNRKSISCLKIIEIMCAYGADPGEGDRTSCKGAIHAALEKRDLKLLELLLSASPASANAKMYNNNTPLHYAATLPNIKEDEQFNIIRLLLEKGADKTIRNSQKKLPIELVCQEHQKVKMLLQARAKKQFRLLCSQSNKDGTSKS